MVSVELSGNSDILKCEGCKREMDRGSVCALPDWLPFWTAKRIEPHVEKCFIYWPGEKQ